MNRPPLEVITLPDWLKDYDRNIEGATYLVNNLRAHSWVLADPAHSDLHPYFNKSLFAAMNNLDLLIGLKYLDLSHRMGFVGEAKYFARIVALHLYEILVAPHKLFDKQTRVSIIDQLGPQALTEINNLMHQLNKIHGECSTNLKRIRNDTIAHREADAVKQADAINQIEPELLMGLANRVFPLQLKITGYYTTIIERIGNS